MSLRLTLVEQERAGLGGRDAGSDGRSTGEPGRPVLLFQQFRARGGVPPDFLSSGPSAYAVGSCSGDFQTRVPPDQPPVPVQMLQRKVHERPGARGRQRRPSGELLCSSSCQEKPRAETFLCAGCLLYPHLVTGRGGGSAGLVGGHSELQRTGAGKEKLSEHQDLC